MHIPRPIPNLPNQKLWRWNPEICILMSLQGDSDAHKFEHSGPRARSRWRRPDSQLECQWLALMNRERQRRNVGSSRPSASKAPILQPPAWPCPHCGWRRSLASIHCKKSAIGCGKSSVCSNTVTGAALCSASHAPALPKVREAGAYSGRQIRSKRQNTMGPSSPERLCAETPGQGWRDLLLKVLRKPSWSSRGVTRVGKAAATGNLQPPA